MPEPIVAAVAQTLVRSGIQRFSLSAAADEAGVSRGTIYNWFGGKKEAIDVAVGFIAGAFIELFAGAVSAKTTLTDQVGEAAVRISDHRAWSDRLDPTLHVSNVLELVLEECGDDLMRRSVEFWVPQVEAAKHRGEIGGDVDATEAAEWIMRTLMSIEVLPAISMDLKDPNRVRGYFSRFILRGLA
ncbi:TetR/AcrR family transcriptional regulator [Mycobacteroides abscessus]|uniref:TetR/AcrR family transcriptional regulator n=1 Tax=Mycobacteroides abscessus TaxID=36809 RepID=UPI0009A5AAFB|nr:TetR/AcrR family transcriptional regulator [Mycobacteroides abscessus]SKT71935.1 TetR family transcriptional regulator [Mycobacteroides abscessus subsp. bolletii]